MKGNPLLARDAVVINNKLLNQYLIRSFILDTPVKSKAPALFSQKIEP